MGNMWTPDNVALIREFSALSMERHGVSGPNPDPGATVVCTEQYCVLGYNFPARQNVHDLSSSEYLMITAYWVSCQISR